jgi:HPt (histidine-containing phosphotransfer) domain-containing protein
MDLRDEAPHESPPPRSAGPLDAASLLALDDLVGHDSELVASLVDAFLEEASVRLVELRAGVEDGDAILLGRAAHTLKSNALTFGALALADLCQELELVARGGDLASARPLVGSVEVEWAAIVPLLEELRRESLS